MKQSAILLCLLFNLGLSLVPDTSTLHNSLNYTGKEDVPRDDIIHDEVVPENNNTLIVTLDENFDVIEPQPTSDIVPIDKVSSKWEKSKEKTKHDIEPPKKSKHFYLDKNNYDVSSPVSTTQPPVVDVDAERCDPSVCPPFRILERRQLYDVRSYPSYRWASTILMTENRFLAQWEGLSRLHNYFNGENEQGAVMNATLPFLTQIKQGRHPGVLHELRDTTISFPIPATFQNQPPIPISADILIDTVDSSTVFVQGFRARLWELTERALRHRAAKFMATLRAHGEAFYDRYYYLASYSRPDNLGNNVYEMWIHATRLRDPKRVRPQIPSRDPPLSKVTARTRKRLCRGVECPSFDVLRVYKFGIQKRRYFDTVLVSATNEDCHFNSLSVWRGFMPLHLYKHGINSHWEVLEATRPIGLVHIRDRVSTNKSAVLTSSCKQNMTVSLYLPERLHSNPPVAGYGAPPVTITKVNDLIVYVQTVGGFLLEPVRAASEVARFAARLKLLGICFKPDEYYLVVYDFLVRFHGRQNEIWLVADKCLEIN